MTPYELKKVVKEAIQEDRTDFYVDPKKHYHHHVVVEDFIEWLDKTKGTAWGAFIRLIVYGLITVTIGGVLSYVYKGGAQ
ncbi:MAG: hypothetical protein KAT46_07285 [Deltaproteobacteria bacterium]|nr:hypothetical protein [Deltaproteobacteria bacterium]